MTYQQLLDWIKTIPSDKLENTVTIFDNYLEEYHPVEDCDYIVSSDVLDEGHPILIINF